MLNAVHNGIRHPFTCDVQCKSACMNRVVFSKLINYSYTAVLHYIEASLETMYVCMNDMVLDKMKFI